jgi:hypothetical protein
MFPASEAEGLWETSKEFAVLDRRDTRGLSLGEGDELPLGGLIELGERICHRLELLHRDVGIKDVIGGEFEKRGVGAASVRPPGATAA